MFNEQVDQEANRSWDKTCLPRNFVTDAEHQSPWSCFSTRYTQNNIVLYVFDDHVIFEGQVSSQRSTRAKSAASFYYCTYLASLEWAIFKTFLKIYGSKYTHQLVLFKSFFQMCLHAPYRKIRISAEVLCSRIGTAFAKQEAYMYIRLTTTQRPRPLARSAVATRFSQYCPRRMQLL